MISQINSKLKNGKIDVDSAREEALGNEIEAPDTIISGLNDEEPKEEDK